MRIKKYKVSMMYLTAVIIAGISVCSAMLTVYAGIVSQRIYTGHRASHNALLAENALLVLQILIFSK